MKINLNNKTFKALENSSNGEVSNETIFHYFQEKSVVWADYKGGSITKGFLIGKIVGDTIEFNYQHINESMELLTGKCKSQPQINIEGRVELLEQWQWTCKDFSKGSSVLIEQ